MEKIGTRLRACVSGITVDSRCSSGNSNESGNGVGALLAGYDGEISSFANMARHAHRQTRTPASFCSPRAFDWWELICLFLSVAQTLERIRGWANERVAEGRRGRERVCGRGKKRRIPFEWKSYSNLGWRMSCEREWPWGFCIMAAKANVTKPLYWSKQILKET